MNFDILYRPSSTVAKVSLSPGDQLTAEAGSMIAMSGHVDVETSTFRRGAGGLLQAAKRLLAGESFFLNQFRTRADGEVWISAPMPGDVVVHELNGKTLIVEAGSFLAAEGGVKIDVGWQGFKNFFSGESLFWIKLSGTGRVLLSAFGSMYPVEASSGYVVDSGHIVAFDETLNFDLSKAGSSWMQSFLGGEGIVCKFRGEGRIYCQTHNKGQFGESLSSYLRPRKG